MTSGMLISPDVERELHTYFTLISPINQYQKETKIIHDNLHILKLKQQKVWVF
jgi:hypothetical protein